MTSRERLLCAFDGGQPDRVPLEIWAVGEVWEALRAHLGGGDHAAVRQRLHLDQHATLSPAYIGPPPPAAPPGESIDWWGMRRRPVDYGSGVYWEQCGWPLAHCRTPADVAAYRWPHPDWFDYASLREQAERLRADHVIEAGYFAPFYFFNLLRGLEQSLLDLILDPALAHAVVDRLGDFFYRYAERLFDACAGLIDVAQLTDDFGGQTSLLIAPAQFDEYFAPHYARLAKLMHDHGVRVFHHDDGALWPLLPRLIDAGIDILNPIQYRCGPIELSWLKAEYGHRLCFHGGVDNQKILPFGTPDEVRDEVRHCLRELAPGGGYVLAPCHNIQAVTPVENILAMYDTAWEEGWY